MAFMSNASDTKTSLANKSQLDFYQSMYHFKKMFPKFETDVIEAVLRSNQGAVDKTIDQLLTMSLDYESESANGDNSSGNNSSTASSSQIFSNDSFMNSSDNTNSPDLPPSYNEIMSNRSSQASFSPVQSEIRSDICSSSGINIAKELINDFPNIYNNQAKATESKSYLSSRFDGLILTGDLPRDFLRIKLTTEQVKKFKNSIKKAKRNELTAILNNKEPEVPELSFELKKRLNKLNRQCNSEESTSISCSSSASSDCENQDNSWIQKMKDDRPQQIIQDEYIARLIQNEEFLNELKTNRDFIQTLNHESNTSIKSNDLEITNYELKNKLNNMGKVSRSKLNKLAQSFLLKAKNKYTKTIDQSTTMCVNFFNSSIGPNHPKQIDYYQGINSGDENIGSDLSGSSRYKKVYKSFKSAIKRTPNSFTVKNSQKLNDSYTSIPYQYENDINNNELLNNQFNDLNLNVFKNGYSYDDYSSSLPVQTNYDSILKNSKYNSGNGKKQ